jgi:hypothetical protein
MGIMQAFRYVVFTSLLCLGSPGGAQTVIIRVVNVGDDRPLRQQEVSVSLLYDKGGPTPAKYDSHLTLQTDENGAARFLLPEPAPRDLDVRVAIDWRRWHCGCNLLISTQDVVQKGIVDSAAPGSKSKGTTDDLVKAVPGEIRFIVRPLSFFERLLAPLLRQ